MTNKLHLERQLMAVSRIFFVFLNTSFGSYRLPFAHFGNNSGESCAKSAFSSQRMPPSLLRHAVIHYFLVCDSIKKCICFFIKRLRKPGCRGFKCHSSEEQCFGGELTKRSSFVLPT